MDMQKLHFDQVANEIREKLNSMSREYDAKLLAIMYMERSVYLLRVLETMGVMDTDEIDRTILGSLQGIHVAFPANELPATKTVGPPRRLS